MLMAVFVPVAFIPGVSGKLYNQFALTVAISVGISAFNSLTLSPALSAAFLRHRGETQFAPFRWFNTGFDKLSHAYAHGVRILIRLRWIMLGLFAAGLVATSSSGRSCPRPSFRSRTRATSSSSSSCLTAPRWNAPTRWRRRRATFCRRRLASTSSARSAA
ncbi:hypothetical protein AJ88_10050 [Mesorhizobium amorphae CCBAU 01583]|nr:hypothetical protein AJ88_10050 [Mesorhizobium amorphae CCBAU 01583]